MVLRRHNRTGQAYSGRSLNGPNWLYSQHERQADRQNHDEIADDVVTDVTNCRHTVCLHRVRAMS
jgi:hypothetical protein